MINSKTLRQLEAIDWDFPVALPGLTKIPHWYPGTFPAQIPATVIQALTAPQEIVFDPYGGVGTTACEAIRLGRKIWIADLNPIGALASLPYCALILLKRISPEKLDLFFQIFAELLLSEPLKVGDERSFDFSKSDQESLSLDSLFHKHFRPTPTKLLADLRQNEPNYAELRPWIHEETLSELVMLRSKVTENLPRGSEVFIRFFLDSMVSANIRAICSQNKSWGHIADNVYPKSLLYKNARQQFRTWLTSLQRALKKIRVNKSGKIDGIQFWYSVIDWNSDTKIVGKPRTRPSIILTSPPYGDAIDYIYAHKLSLYYLGYSKADIDMLCSKEMGARRKRFKTDSRLHWAEQISNAAVKQSMFLETGLFVTVLPHKNHGREIGINHLKQELDKTGWQVCFQIDRSINQNKTRQSWTSIKQETITIFEKG